MQASMNSHCACVRVSVCACVCVQITTYVRLCADYYLIKSTWRTTTSFHTLTLDIDRAKQIFLNYPRFSDIYMPQFVVGTWLFRLGPPKQAAFVS